MASGINLPTPEQVAERWSLNFFALNLQTRTDLAAFLNGIVQEASDRVMLDARFVTLWETGSDIQKRNIVNLIARIAACMALDRPLVFKLLGQHAPLQMQDPDAFEDFCARMSADVDSLSEDIIDSIVTGEGGAVGPLTHGFPPLDERVFRRVSPTVRSSW